jgi:putative transposase
MLISLPVADLSKKEFPQIKVKLWKEYFWSRSFCLITTGGANIETIKKYIQSQGLKDGKQSNQVQIISYN